MKVITGCTDFFIDKWIEINGTKPDIEELNDWVLNKSLCVQSFLVYFNKKKESVQRILACYWIPSKNIIVKVDIESKSAVTWYSPEDAKNKE